MDKTTDSNAPLLSEEDDDVARERDLVAKSDSLVQISDLSKTYPSSNGYYSFPLWCIIYNYLYKIINMINI